MSAPVLVRFASDAVRLDAHVEGREDAIVLACDGLVKLRAALPTYANRVNRVFDEFGPYMVIDPGIALVHAQPGADTNANALSLVRLAEPVPFGHDDYDPVLLVIALCSRNPSDHLKLVSALANLMDDARLRQELREAGTAERACAVMQARFREVHIEGVDTSPLPTEPEPPRPNEW